MNKYHIIILINLIQLPFSCLFAQKPQDTISVNNGDVIIAEVLGMEKNRLYIDTDYGYGKWEIKWHTVIGINTKNTFNIGLISGEIYYGYLKTLADGSIQIIRKNLPPVTCNLNEIVWMRQYFENFFNQFSGSISLGLSQSRARNLVSLTSNGDIDYTAKRSLINLYYNSLYSSQDQTADIFRYEITIGYIYTLPKHYFGFASSSFLSNTEQQLDGRLNVQAGLGNFIVENQRNKFSILVGANQNVERFNNENSKNSSWEGLLQADFDLFNLSSLKIKAKALAFPGITQKGRWRTDFKFYIKYDIKYLKKTNLTNKIFIKLGVSANYDNQPAANANELDYVLSTTLGISWHE